MHEKLYNDDFYKALIEEEKLLIKMTKDAPLVFPLSKINHGSLKEGDGYFVNPFLSHLLNKHLDLFFGHDSELLTIKESAFSSSDVTTVTIPNSVTTSEDMAFGNCDKLTTFNIPKDS